MADSHAVIDCVIGPRYAAVRMDCGTGLAFMTEAAWARAETRGVTVVEKSLTGMGAQDAVSLYTEKDALSVVLGLAAVNALLIHKGTEALEDWGTLLAGKKRLGMVGYFRFLMERIRQSGVETIVFELQELPGTHRPEEAPDLLPGCDIVLVTGASFANKSVHTYLPHVAPQAEVCIVGPSTPLADTLLARFSLGSSMAADIDRVFAAIRQGHGMQGMKHCLRKVGRRRRVLER